MSLDSKVLHNLPERREMRGWSENTVANSAYAVEKFEVARPGWKVENKLLGVIWYDF